MPIVANERYSQERIQHIQQYLKTLEENNQPLEYEITVDSMKAVPRTFNVELFPLHESFVGPQTGAVQISIFRGESRYCDKYILYFREDYASGGLGGVGGVSVQKQIQDAVKKSEERRDRLDLEKEKAALELDVAELEKENTRLNAQVAELQAKLSPMHSVLGNVGSAVVESFIKRNPQIMAALPGGETLSGVMDAPRMIQQELESEVSFSPKGTGTANPDQEFAVSFMEQLKLAFGPDGFDKAIHILNACVIDPPLLDTLTDLLKNQKSL